MPERTYLLVATWSPRSVRRYDAETLAFTDTFVPLPATPGAGAGFFDWLTGLEFGPDGNLYIADWQNSRILRFRRGNGAPMGEFVPTGSGGLDRPGGLTFGPDGHLYVANRSLLGNDNPPAGILRFHGQTGAFLGDFVPPGASGGLMRPYTPIFGPDGHLYVCDNHGDRVLRYDGVTGSYLGDFVPKGTGGLDFPIGQCFGPEGDLYVTSDSRVLRYAGGTGTFLGEFVGAAAGLNLAAGMRFGPDERLYVANVSSGQVLVFSPSGVKEDALAVWDGKANAPTTLCFGVLPMPLPRVPDLWQRVPRWLQVIGLLALVSAVVRLLAPVSRRR